MATFGQRLNENSQQIIYQRGNGQQELAPAETAETVAVLAESSARKKSWTKWLWLAAAAFVVFQIYYVREMLAILVIFAGLFFVVAIIAGIVYAVGRAGESTIVAAEPMARRGMEIAEDVSRKTFRRPRSAPAP